MSKYEGEKELGIEKIVERLRHTEQEDRGPELGDCADFSSRRERNVKAPFTKRSKLKISTNGSSEDDEKRDVKSRSVSSSIRPIRAADVSPESTTSSSRPSPLSSPPPKDSAPSPRPSSVLEYNQRRDWNMDNVDLEHLVGEDDLYYGTGDFDDFSDDDSLLHYGDFSADRKDRGHSGCQCFSFSGLFKRRKR